MQPTVPQTHKLLRERVGLFLQKDLIENGRPQLKKWTRILSRSELDDVAINRASMGYCGNYDCCNPPLTKKTLSRLAFVISNELDADVVDSFCGSACMNLYLTMRKRQREEGSLFVPKELVDLYLEGGGKVPLIEEIELPRLPPNKPKVKVLIDERSGLNPDLVKDVEERKSPQPESDNKRVDGLEESGTMGGPTGSRMGGATGSRMSTVPETSVVTTAGDAKTEEAVAKATDGWEVGPKKVLKELEIECITDMRELMDLEHDKDFLEGLKAPLRKKVSWQMAKNRS